MCLVPETLLQLSETEPFRVYWMLLWPGMQHCKFVILSVWKCQQNIILQYLCNRILFYLGTFCPIIHEIIVTVAYGHIFYWNFGVVHSSVCTWFTVLFSNRWRIFCIKIIGPVSLEHSGIETSSFRVACLDWLPACAAATEDGGSKCNI